MLRHRLRPGRTDQRALNRQYDAIIARLQAANPGYNYTVPSRNIYDRLTDIDASLKAGNKIGGASLRVKWDVGPGTLTSITAWRFWDWKPENDRDFTGASVVARSQNPSQQDQYSQELRYNYEGDRVDFVVGLFGFRQRIDTQGTEQQGIDAARYSLAPSTDPNNVYNRPEVLNGLTASNTQFLKADSAALYGQVSYKLTPALTIQPGIRINYDKKQGLYRRVVTTGSGQVITSCAPSATAGNAVLTAQCGVYQPQLTEPSVSDWNVSYDLNLNYKVAPDMLAYATYAKSFKTVGINQNGLPLDTNNQPVLSASTVKPESVDHFEIGLKTQLLNRLATFNLTAFRTEIKNFQATVNGGQFGTVRGYLANADKVVSQGIELISRSVPATGSPLMPTALTPTPNINASPTRHARPNCPAGRSSLPMPRPIIRSRASLARPARASATFREPTCPAYPDGRFPMVRKPTFLPRCWPKKARSIWASMAIIARTGTRTRRRRSIPMSKAMRLPISASGFALTGSIFSDGSAMPSTSNISKRCKWRRAMSG